MQKKYAKPKKVNRMERIITEYRQSGGDRDWGQNSGDGLGMGTMVVGMRRGWK